MQAPMTPLQAQSKIDGATQSFYCVEGGSGGDDSAAVAMGTLPDFVQVHPEVVTLRDELIADRREMHRNAELSFEEVWTSAFIAQRLTSLGLSPTTGLGAAPAAFRGARISSYAKPAAGTGVTATIVGGGGPGPCLCFRADHDALPIQELPDSKAAAEGYASLNAGVAHMCGHDAHPAMLLAAAKVLMLSPGLRESMRGSVKLLFQPAEVLPCLLLLLLPLAATAARACADLLLGVRRGGEVHD